jgi:hypothetical protein
MNHATLLRAADWPAFAGRGTRALARAALDGSVGAAYALADLLIDEGAGALLMDLEIGQSYLIRTVTHYYTGRVTAVSFGSITLEDAAWIPDTGRFSDCLRTGQVAECEPFPAGVLLAAAAIVDAAPWPHRLPREVQ